MFDRFRRLFSPPIFEHEEKTRLAKILNSFAWSAIGVLLFVILIRVIIGAENGVVPLLILSGIVLILGGAQVFIRRGYIRGAGIFLVGGLWVAMTYQAWAADGIHDMATTAYLAIILLAALLLGWREGLIVGALSIAMVWWFAVQEHLGFRVEQVDAPLNIARDLTVIFILTSALIYLLINSLNHSLYDARLELKERLRAEEKLQRQADYLTALHETALGLLNRSELHSLLETILTRACELNDTQHGIIELVLPDGSALRQEMGFGVYEKLNGMLTKKNIGVTGTVWANARSIAINNYITWEHHIPTFVAAGFQAVMGVPLKSGETVIGVLAFAYIEAGRKFSLEQIKLIERFAAIASLAIDNTRLYELAQKELQERRNTESALRSSEERFRKVFNNSYVAISIVTLEDGTFLDANEAFWRLSGLQPEQALGHTSLELNLWDEPQARNDFVRELLEKQSLQNVQVEFENEDGPNKTSVAFYELTYIGDQLCILCMFYDLSEQIQTQRALKENEERMRAILTSIPDMIFEVAKDGTFLDFMASTEYEPPMTSSQIVGRNIKELFPPVIADQTFFALERALASGQLHAFEYGMPPGEETQFFEARITSITSESAIIMVRDISQQKYVQTEREKLIKELEDKNSELERFSYTVSHDLKSPLITIKGFLGFLEQDAASGNTARLKIDLQRIADATDKMQGLLNELLELSRIGRLVNPHQFIPFNEIVQEALDIVHGRLQENSVQVHVQANMPTVYGDRQRLIEVLQNLIDNAAKFTSTHPEPRIEIGYDQDEEHKPIFYVRDNGIGIDPIHHDRIFGLFNKLDVNSDGSGVGLAIVKRIIEIHNGKIWVQSASSPKGEAGSGASFFFTLPTAPES